MREPEDLHVFVRKVAIVFAFAIATVLIWFIRDILVLIFVAAVLAAGIAPIVKRVQVFARLYTHRRIARGTAVMLVYFPFLIGAVLLAVFVLPSLLMESRDLAAQVPQLLEQNILRPISRYVPFDVHQVLEVLSKGDSGWKSLPIFGYLKGAVHLVVSCVAVLFMIVYMLIDAERLRNLFLLFYPAEERWRKRRMVIRMSRRMSYWLAGQLILCGLVGVATFTGLVLLRVPYAVPLALLAAVGELVPIIGPVVGAVPSLIVALFQSPWQFWSVLVMAIVIQQVENYLLVPRIMGKKTSVSPLAVFVAFMIGGSLLGIIGGVLAIPIAAIVRVAFEEAFVSRRERRRNADRVGSLVKPAE